MLQEGFNQNLEPPATAGGFFVPGGQSLLWQVIRFGGQSLLWQLLVAYVDNVEASTSIVEASFHLPYLYKSSSFSNEKLRLLLNSQSSGISTRPALTGLS